MQRTRYFLLWLLALPTLVRAQTTTSFSYTGSPQTYTVPAGVTRLQVVATGAAGGVRDGAAYAVGAQVQATVSVIAGEVLTVVVGGQGANSHVSDGKGGYNGGGNGATGGIGGGGGGGATDLRRDATTQGRTPDYLATRNALLVAAGAGGGFYDASFRGGAGGTPQGQNGSSGGDTGGTGASQAGPGSGQSNSSTTNGSGSTGGSAGLDNGGGGGGGYYGGGAGGSGSSPGSGGGGSSWAPAEFNPAYSLANAAGDGALTITPLYAKPTLTSLSPTSGPVGTRVTLTGQDLGSATGVSFNGTGAAFTANANGTLTATVPTGATSGNVVVTTPGGLSSGLPFTVVAPVVLTTSSPLPSGTVGVAYSLTFQATGGAGTYTFTVAAGSALPPGLTLASTGTLSGTPTGGGSFTFTVQATDNSAAPGPYSGSKQYTLSIAAPTITLSPSSLPGGTVGVAYSQTLTASGGTAPYSYALTAGALPNGLTLSSTGSLAGTPTQSGTFSFTVRATDASTGTGPYSGSQPYTLRIAAPGPTLSSFSPTSGPVGTQVTITGTGFTSGSTTVAFNGTAAMAVTVTAATSLTATVPAGATTGPITVTTPGGPATSATNFTVTAPVALAVVSTRPGRNALGTPVATPVALTYNQAVDPASTGGLRVFSHLTQGRKATVISTSGSTVTLTPAVAFQPGETVLVTSPASVRPAAGSGLASVPYVYQFTTAAGAGPGTFSGGASLAAGLLPASVALADVNGDGRLDLLTTNGTRTGTVTIRLGTGRGSFAASTSSVSVGAYPAYLVTADVDADGDLDLLVANTGANSVSVRLNDGLGGFSGSQNVAVGSYPISVAAADVDGDGDLDLVAANLGSDNASVRLNDGQGTFSGSQSVAAGPNPSSVAAADVDNDGDVDLLLTNADRAGTVSVRLNNGLGLFSGTSSVAVGSYPTHVTAADLNADGNLDLLTANATDPGTVSVRLGDGQGSFTGGQEVAVGRRPASVAAADVDGDGDLDVLTANAAGNTVSVRLNSGRGLFSGSQEVAVGCAPLRAALADLDGDGDLDLATADAGSGSVSVRLNQAPAGSSARTNALAGGSEPASPLHPFADGNLFRQLTGQAAAADEQLTTSLEVYPNPATAATRVRFGLAQDEVVSLQLYNALGQLVATLYEGPAAAGQVVEQPLAALALPTGVYLCRLTLRSGPSLSQRLVVK